MFVTGGYHEDPSPSIIVVMGTTGSGKTSFINLASKSTLDVGTNLKSCTEEVQASEQFTVDGHPVVLIDTPGFQDTSKSDMDILDSIAQSLAAWCEQGERLGGIIYVHRISDVRFSGTAIKNFKTLLAMCGTKALQNVVIVTNMWGKVTPEVGVSREQELVSNFFKPALENGALLLRHNDTTESAHDIIRDVLSKQRVTLQIQEEIIYQSKRIGETAAGKGLLRELDAQVARRLGQLQELHEMLNQIEADDGETRQELQQEVLNLREELVTLTRSGAPGKAMSSFREGVQGGIFFTLLGAGFLLWKRSIFANLFDSLFSWPPHT